jgi:hypothetical protein
MTRVLAGQMSVGCRSGRRGRRFKSCHPDQCYRRSDQVFRASGAGPFWLLAAFASFLRPIFCDRAALKALTAAGSENQAKAQVGFAPLKGNCERVSTLASNA